MLILAFLVLLAHWFLIFIKYRTIPETIPVHFNAKGEADKWGKKHLIFIFPIIASLLFLFMLWAIKYGKINAPSSFDLDDIRLMFRHLIFSTQLIFLGISFLSIEVARHKKSNLGKIFLWISLVLIFYPFLFCIHSFI